MAFPKKRKKKTFKTLSEKDVQKHLYGQIDKELESIKNDIAETTEKVQNIKRTRQVMADIKILPLKIIAVALVITSIFFIYKNSGNWFKNMLATERKPSTKVDEAKDLSTKLYTIQTAVYKSKKDAGAFNSVLSSKGYEPFVNMYNTRKGTAMYRVCVGKLASKNEARILLKKLRKEKGATDSFLINLP